ncbi:MAG: S-layer homology domain-containing protein [Coleofasciculaceae cyanobacterium]
MTNIPPPDRRSSALGFDEFIAVVIAFAVIGTIFLVSVRQKQVSLKNSTPSPKTSTDSPNAAAIPIPVPINQNPVTSIDPIPATATPTPQAKLAPPAKILPETSSFSTVPPILAISPVIGRIQQIPARTVDFPDLPQVFWARPYIEALANRGVLSGYEDGNFRPNQVVTRAEFASVLQKAFDQKVEVPGQEYKDISDRFWASSAIQEATRSGFLSGYPDNTFRPQKQISKVEALVSLTNGLDLTAKEKPSQVLKTYQDAKIIPKYARDIIAVATEYGLVVNYPNRQILNPNKPLTRAEASALIYQGMVQAGKVPAITSEYVAKPQ